MLIWRQTPGGGTPGSGSPTTMTLPSAGDTTSSGPRTAERSGSRKKNTKKATNTSGVTAHPRCPKYATARATNAATPMKG